MYNFFWYKKDNKSNEQKKYINFQYRYINLYNV